MSAFLNAYPLGNEWRRPFERAFHRRLDPVRCYAGPAIEPVLAGLNALALTLDPETILLSGRFGRLSKKHRQFVIGHELAHTVQLSHPGEDAVPDLEAEAWRAAAAALAGDRFRIRGRSTRPLAALALVQNEDARRYFSRYPVMLDVRITQTQLIRPFHFERLIDLMLQSDEHDFLIESHGEPEALIIRLRQGSQADVSRDILERLSRMYRVHRAMEQASGDNLSRWAAVMDSIGERLPDSRIPWLERIGRPGTGDDPRRIREAKELARRWLIQQAQAIELNEEQMDRYLAKMRRLHDKGLRKIEFRGCNVGRALAMLQSLRRFFGAQRIGALDTYSGFGEMRVGIGRGSIAALLRRHPQAQIYGAPGQQFAIRIIVHANHSASIFAAADSREVVRRWIADHVMAGETPQQQPFPLHWIETTPRVFARDPAYRQHVKYSTELWFMDLPPAGPAALPGAA
jgi:hypothetical protein